MKAYVKCLFKDNIIEDYLRFHNFWLIIFYAFYFKNFYVGSYLHFLNFYLYKSKVIYRVIIFDSQHFEFGAIVFSVFHSFNVVKL